MIAGIAMLTMVTSSSPMNMPIETAHEDPPLARVALVEGRVESRVAHCACPSDGGVLWRRCRLTFARAGERDERLFEGGGDDAERGGDAARVERSLDAGGVAAGHAQRPADEGRREAAPVESREGGLPARRLDGDGRALADDAGRGALRDDAARRPSRRGGRRSLPRRDDAWSRARRRRLAAAPWIDSQSRARADGSTPEVGSSRTSSSGACARAAANASRRRRPCGRSRTSESRSASRSASSRGTALPKARAEKARFSCTVRSSHRPRPCGT